MEVMGSQERETKVVMFILGVLNSLQDSGCDLETTLEVTPEGEESYQNLLREGFSPTTAEIESVMDYLKEEGIIKGTGIFLGTQILKMKEN